MEKKPPWLGDETPFSGIGVIGAVVIFESLLGPRDADEDLILRCEIIFPEGEVTTLESEEVGRACGEKRLEVWSVGVGGVLVIVGGSGRRVSDGGV